jgi:hypothetical protein
MRAAAERKRKNSSLNLHGFVSVFDETTKREVEDVDKG